MSKAISIGDDGEHVRVHQRHLNDRLRNHGAKPLPVNGKCGPKVVEQTAFAAWFLGALLQTVESVRAGTIPAGVQRIIANPDSREPAQRRRARERRHQPFPAGDGSSNGFRIIPCSEWGAAAAKGRIVRVGKPTKIIFHHTFGHHPELDHKPGESLEEAKAYARQIQRDHFNRGFIDSGHNFLVTRSGHILEGRHGSLAAITAGVMVDSAHTIGQNHQPGIEHEHFKEAAMTPVQREASLFLHALICRKTGVKPTAVHPHRQFDSTACPAELLSSLPQFRKDLAKQLT